MYAKGNDVVRRWSERQGRAVVGARTGATLTPEWADPAERQLDLICIRRRCLPVPLQPTGRRYLARSLRAKGSFRQLPPTCMVA